MSDEQPPQYQPPQPPAPPQYQTPPAQYAAAPASGSEPGKVLGIVGFIVSLPILFPLVGLILSIIAKVQSKKAGVKNSLATAGIWIGAIFTGIGIIVGVIAIIAAVAFAAWFNQKCDELGSGEHVVDNVTINCPVS